MSSNDLFVHDTISIIIPVYNNAPYLKQCLDSVCGQTYPHLEIVAVNDGSEDDSLKILESYANSDDRIKVINQKNQGVSASRNCGLEVASGQYIMFLDGDDWIESVTCEKAISISEETNADIVLWPYCREYSAQRKPVYILGEYKQQWNKNNIHELYKRLIGIDGEQLREPEKIDSVSVVWGKLYKKNLLDNVHFIDLDKIGTSEDTLYNIFVFSKAESAVYIPDLYSHYRKTNATSITSGYKKDLVSKWGNLYSLIKAHLDENKASEEFYKALNNRIALGLIGLGLNIVQGTNLSYIESIKELRMILSMDQYKKALKDLPMEYFPVHWKLFFDCARKEAVIPMYVLLKIMNYLRGH